jgi:hypothetical protein
MEAIGLAVRKPEANVTHPETWIFEFHFALVHRPFNWHAD